MARAAVGRLITVVRTNSACSKATSPSPRWLSRVVAVHEDIGAGLDFVEDTAVALVHEACRCRRRSRARRPGRSPRWPSRVMRAASAASRIAPRAPAARAGAGPARGSTAGRQSAAGALVAICRASGTASSPGATPQRLAPTLTSTYTSSVTPCALRRGGQRLHLLRVVDQHADARLARQRRQVTQLGVADHLVGDQHVTDAGLRRTRPLRSTFWQQTPTAPSATCRKAISGHLWLLA